jgi:N-formylglutamate amidohydrolase
LLERLSRSAIWIARIARHGRPAERRARLQLEVNCDLCMDAGTIARHPGFARLQAQLSQLVQAACTHARLAAA